MDFSNFNKPNETEILGNELSYDSFVINLLLKQLLMDPFTRH